MSLKTLDILNDLYKDQDSYGVIAKRHGVSRSYVAFIKKSNNVTHTMRENPGRPRGRSPLLIIRDEEIVKLVLAGMSVKEVCDGYHLTKATVYTILHTAGYCPRTTCTTSWLKKEVATEPMASMPSSIPI